VSNQPEAVHLAAVSTLAARTALGRHGTHGNHLLDVAPVLADLCSDVENLSPQLVGVRHLDTLAAG
jgi:hypothetical protein